MPRIRVTVAVLGDLGRSPRMLYHASALADSIADVDLVGSVEHVLPVAVAAHPHVHVHAVPAPRVAGRHRLPRAVFLLVAAVNVLRQTIVLCDVLLRRVPRPDVILLQNPPALPTLLVGWMAARWRGARLIVDWHNLGWAMLALQLGDRHWAVRAVRRLEGVLARRADAHLCVSQALAAALAAWGVHAPVVLADRPGAAFTPPSPAAARDSRARLAAWVGLPALADERTRPAVVVSPTSWSSDEDFDLLIDAACAWDARASAAGGPALAIVVSGDGPRRAMYEQRFAALALTHVHLRTLWVAAEDYPALLAAADLGLSLHRSASGLDLPMKVLDCFGAGVPVCAFDYAPCLRELVRDGENGLLFRDAAGLVACLASVFDGFPAAAPLVDRLRAGAAAETRLRWPEAWARIARPLFETPPAT